MSENSSSSSNDSLLHPSLFSMSFNFPYGIQCFLSRPTSFVFSAYIIVSVFLLVTLCIFVIYHGLQQWRQKCSNSSAATMSHSDSFTYHMVIMELIRVFGCVLCLCGIYSDHLNIFLVGFGLLCFTWYGEMFFHVLTCVERYLAVVHPITYLSLRRERGIRIRNISIGCVWLICVVGTSLMRLENFSIVGNFFIPLFSVTVVSFCSLSVLCVLIRPGPGDQGGGRERVDQSKQRAFYTIMAILGVLVLMFAWSLVWAVLSVLGRRANCAIVASGLWFNLPCALVLPLLFLHRAGKLGCCKNNIQ